MARMLATFLLLLSLGSIIFNHANAQDPEEPYINVCSDVDPSGVFLINQPGPEPVTSFHAYCSFDVVGGGWTVFQRRFDGTQDFYLGWEDYVNGFGRYEGEFWLGLGKLHQMTNYGKWRLKVLLEDWDGSTAYAEYDSFRIGDEASNYQLTIGGYSGTAGDSMDYHNGIAFTTKDRDNDLWSADNCADMRNSAWWYNGCSYSNLNGLYLGQSDNDVTGINWYHWKNSHYHSLKSSTMMISPN